MSVTSWLRALALAAPFGAAQAAGIASVSPQGEVAQVRQVVVRFDAAVVNAGDLRGADPVSVACEGGTPAGGGRWVDAKSWVFDFSAPLPPGRRCAIAARAGWKPLQGELTGRTDYAFSTGGPAVQRITPWQGGQVEEDQHFLLELNGAAAEASVTSNAWCEVDGIGDRIPVRVVAGAVRDEVIRARRLQKKAPLLLLLACQRPLPAGAKMRLVWGAGIKTATNPAVATSQPQFFDYEVRPAFNAEFSCERERANAPCLPVRPLGLRFSAPVERSVAAQVRLKPAAGGAAIAPLFDKDDKASEVYALNFPKPLPASATFTIELPPGLKDTSGRPLANAASFPLKVATGEAPPLAKFAIAPFGIVEREGGSAVLPLTLRHVQGDLKPGAGSGRVRLLRLDKPADVLAWFGRLRHDQENENETRKQSLLADEAEARRLDLPALQGGEPRPLEVIGIPIAEPGYHVVEVESQRLGASLLDPAAPMYVRTGVLATNLGLHFKAGRESSLAWVTTLDRAQPVAAADVTVHDCHGNALWSGRTGADGVAHIPRGFERAEWGMGCPAEPGLFVTTSKADPKGVVDRSFLFTSWQRGIESWRFHVATGGGTGADLRVHTVFDRTLLRAGETVSMKHFVRNETSTGLAATPPEQRPASAKIVHEGSGQEFALPLRWHGARSAESSWTIPATAKLGSYRVVLQRGSQQWSGGDFRVEQFRVPLVDARLVPPKGPVVAPPSLAFGVQMNYLAGGAMAQAPLRVSALLRPRSSHVAGYEGYSFEPPRGDALAPERDDDEEPQREGRLVADKIALRTDTQGAANFSLPALPALTRPSELLTELSFDDPNGERQTVTSTVPLWPAGLQLGVRASRWTSTRGPVAFSVIALDLAGKILVGQKVEVRGRNVQIVSTRKRMVGGFYAYDNRNEVKDLGLLCSGRTDDRGLLNCEATLDSAGQVEIVASAQDTAGRSTQAADTLWITRQDELWFAQDNDDRIDLLPEKKRYEPGEIAKLQVRMPFREATVLLAVEREGVIESRVLTLRGRDPTIELPIAKDWAPNVYVSVLALRGRVRSVPWYSFFSWGWKEPLNWARAYWYEGRDYQPPTAMVDLAKPAFKLGVAALKVGLAAHELQVTVTPDKPQYLIREKATARVRVMQGGKPAAGAEVAFAAVDEALLALRPNGSWDLLNAMLRERPWSVETSTAQGEIVGRRHYGRKAVAAGGGGGRGGTRELFETLLLWKGVVALDGNGEAVVEVPLNDSLTSFRLVAVADAGTQQFGSGSATIRVTQELQLLPGLPPLVREGDRFDALVTLRNTTAREMKLRATLAGAGLKLAPQELVLAAGAAKEVGWPVEVPADLGAITWEAAVEEVGGRSKDRVKITQTVVPAVPVRVLQATLQQLDGSATMPMAAPADALPAQGAKRGGVVVGLQPKLSAALPGIRRYFETYPFICLEQKASKAAGLRDAGLWSLVANQLPAYLDRDGLANYFPPRPEDPPSGSDRLTAYVLQATHEAGLELPAAARDAMLEGLTAFVQGRIERKFWSPKPDIEVRKIAAIEALSRYGRATPKLLGSINPTPNVWPTAAVIDWLKILKRVDGIPEQAQRLAEVQQILRARLTFAGTTLRFSSEDDDFWWWLMESADGNAAKLVLAVLDDPAWREDLPRLVVGSLGRQKRGAWLTTTANLWGSLALDKFAARFESQKIAGRSSASLGGATQNLDWAKNAEGGRMQLPWPAGAAPLTVQHNGSGKPWLTVQSLAAIPLTEPLLAGYTIVRGTSAVEQKTTGRWTRGDLMRVRLEIDAQSDMTWVVVSDPVPAGATVLGSGLGRDSAIATQGEKREGRGWLAFEERSFEAFRSYFERLPRGRHVIEYTVRLNNPGRFGLPPTRVEAMYAPETFGERPNAPLEVLP